MEELLEWIGRGWYISTIDMTKSYWQIPMVKNNQQKTAFDTPWRLFEFTRMLFGLHEAVATFQRLMDHVLVLHTMYATAYIDDVVIYSQT